MTFPFLGIAWRNIRLNWRHSLAALLAVSASFVSLSLFQCYMLNVDHLYEESYTHRAMYAHVIIEKTDAQTKGKEDPIAFELHKKDQEFVDAFLKAQPEFQTRVRVLNVMGMITDGKLNTVFTGYAYDPSEGAQIRAPHWTWDVTSGKPLNASDEPNRMVLGKRLGELMGCRGVSHESYLSKEGGFIAKDREMKCDSDTLQLSVTTDSAQVNAMDFKVTGIRDYAFREIDSRFVSMPLEAAQKLFDTDGVSYEAVLLKNGAAAVAFARRFNEASRVQGLEISATRWQEHPFGDLYVRSMDFLSIFRNFVVAVIVAIAGLSVLNSFVKIVKERTREIGTLRSIGFLGNQIIGMFTAEAAFVAFFGSLGGLLFTLTVTLILNAVAFPYKAGMLAEPVPFHIEVAPTVYLTTTLFLCGISVAAALIPAYHTTRFKVADNLMEV